MRRRVLSILNPTIQDGVNNFYGKYLTVPPAAGSASVTIVNIAPGVPGGYNVTLSVLPYYGPHNSVGKDEILLHITGSLAEITSFRHLESYGIPESYKDYIIQWLPA